MNRATFARALSKHEPDSATAAKPLTIRMAAQDNVAVVANDGGLR